MKKLKKSVSKSRRHEHKESVVQDMISTGAGMGRKKIIALLITAFCLVAVFSLYYGYMQNRESTAAQFLAQARSAEELESVYEKYSDTAAGPLALLEAASLYLQEEKYETAEQAYRTFIQEYPGSLVSDTALLGLGYTYEARGDRKQAVQHYRLLAGDVDGYLYQEALSGVLRCREEGKQQSEEDDVSLILSQSDDFFYSALSIIPNLKNVNRS